MAQSVNLWGATYSDVPAIEVPKSGGGMASFTDVTDTTAAASDVATGKYFYTAAGVRTQGTGSGGGGSGLEYETGTYTPTSDIARPQITWTKTHTEAPVLVFMCDVTGTAHSATNSNYMFTYCDPYKLWGAGYPYSESGFRYAVVYYSYRTSSTTSVSSSGFLIPNNSDSTSSSSTSYPRYWASPTDFHPYSASNSRYWRSGRTYKWIAVWKPTT